MLSNPSQSSADGVPATASHASAPPEHCIVPSTEHSPIPAAHAAPPSGLPSSTILLQLLSNPSQSSADGVPATALQDSVPPEHS